MGYRPLDIIPNNVKQHGVYGSNHNIFEANQMPYPKCDCFWAKQKYVLKPNQLKSNMVPVEPFTNNYGIDNWNILMEKKLSWEILYVGLVPIP